MSLSVKPIAQNQMHIVERADTLRLHVSSARREGRRIGVVPTMGALHAGHLSLIDAARAECEFVVLTIFVNPTQFGPGEDFERYPRPLEDDLAQCRQAGVDLVFRPGVEAAYPPGFSTFVEVEALSSVLEGAFRPAHFRGVTTIVLKLLNVVQPDLAYFGRKDYQQQLLIRRMCVDLDVPVEIRTCPTVREPDGLALSSRNAYLTSDERRSALALLQSLSLAEQRLLGGATDVAAVRAEMRSLLDRTPGVSVDYATVCGPETLEELSVPQPEMIALAAARVGKTRLIDNLPIVLPRIER
ncbi:MAG: pantoate--beta-alanine ligase [Planctomycetaceae bacterium]